MNKVFCDRCGKECVEGSAYYTIDIYGFDVNPTNDGRMSLDAATQNMETNLTKAAKTQRHYCKQCKDEIAQFMCQKKEDNPQVINDKLNNLRTYIDELRNKHKNDKSI